VPLRIIPREERFFDLFADDMANVLVGARALEEMLRNYTDLEKKAADLRAIEHRGDEISHDIGSRLARTFVTPFDREDIHALISGIDDIIDGIEEVADTFVLYGIKAPTPEAIRQAEIITAQCLQLHEAMTKLKGFKELDAYRVEVHRLENEGDRIARGAVAALFDGRHEALDVIRWKEIYQLLEGTIDTCEDVADIIERITIKHA
jgi:uncharacterized protein